MYSDIKASFLQMVSDLDTGRQSVRRRVQSRACSQYYKYFTVHSFMVLWLDCRAPAATSIDPHPTTFNKTCLWRLANFFDIPYTESVFSL